MPYEILLQHVSIVSCLCIFGISHFGLYYLYSSTNYFKDENDCGHYAYTHNNGLEEEYVIFNIGSENAESEISKELVIPVEQAYIAAMDFFETCEMSKRMKWFEL